MNEHNDDYDGYLMYLVTLQGPPIKTLTESLKEILTDINFNFDETGLSVMNMDPGKISFVTLKLHADKFDKYYCPNELPIGVNMLSLHKLLKTIGNNDTVCMYVTEEKPDELAIKIQNKKKRINNNLYYNLLDVDVVTFDIPEVDYDAHIMMPCGDFQKYCRELGTVSSSVTLLTSNKKFSMSVDGQFARQKLEIEESDDSTIIIETANPDTEDIPMGTYSLKFLNLFCKSSTLCQTIQIYVKKDEYIVLVYSVASLGTLRFCLCPQVELED